MGRGEWRKGVGVEDGRGCREWQDFGEEVSWVDEIDGSYF
jgi:hypothetical protein